MTPYDPPMIAACLRTMPDARLATIHPQDFQRWPLQHLTPVKLVRELIANERARRNAPANKPMKGWGGGL